MAVHGGTDLVTDGLIHCIDALDKQSYIGSGTTVNNVIGASTGTLTNATFNTSGYFYNLVNYFKFNFPKIFLFQLMWI